MAYAINGQVSQAPIDGGIEISQSQYEQAIAGMCDGLEVTIDDGFKVAAKPEPIVEPSPEPTLADLKSAKLATINAACTAAIDAGFEHDGHTYDSDLVSRTNIIGTAAGVNSGIVLPEDFTWRTKDNQNVAMDGPGVIALGGSLLAHVNTQYAISWQLKAQVDASDDPGGLDSIVWPSGV